MSSELAPKSRQNRVQKKFGTHISAKTGKAMLSGANTRFWGRVGPKSEKCTENLCQLAVQLTKIRARARPFVCQPVGSHPPVCHSLDPRSDVKSTASPAALGREVDCVARRDLAHTARAVPGLHAHTALDLRSRILRSTFTRAYCARLSLAQYARAVPGLHAHTALGRNIDYVARRART